jgi:hypothetical protein
MKPWTESQACRSRVACRRCRDPRATAWRRSLATAYALPSDNVNFACPHGLPWSAPAAPDHEQAQAPNMPQMASAVPRPPSWDHIRTQIAAVWPGWLPEFDASRAGLAGCTACQDKARRRRWAERIAALPPAPAAL